MNTSIAASTSDTIRVWHLGIDGPTAGTSAAQLHSRRSSSALYGDIGYSSSSEQPSVSTTSIVDVDPLPDTIDSVSCISWAADGGKFVAAGKGSCMRQLDSAGGLVQDIKMSGKGDSVDYMDIVAAQHYGHASESLFVANNTTRQVRRWDFVKREYAAICQTHENDISCMAVSTRKRLVVSATASGGEIAVFNLLHNTRSDLRSATHRSLTCVDISPGHRSQIAVGSEDGLVQLFDHARLEAAPVKTYSHVHSAPVRGICFHADSASTVVSAGLDGRVVVTDGNAYVPRSARGSGSNGSSGGGGSSSRGALDISAGVPLTCLSGNANPFVVAAGTIDGDVLVFDIRGQQKPLWKGTVSAGRPVTSLSFAPASRAQGDRLSRVFKRADSTNASQRTPLSNPYVGSTRRSYLDSGSDDGVAALLAECRNRRSRGAAAISSSNDNKKDDDDDSNGGGEMRENHPPFLSSSAANGAVKSDGDVFRPPQHPIIGRHRAAATGSTPAQSAYRPRTKAYLGALSSEDKPAADDEMHIVDENASIMRNDRSFMDLLSPEKPEKTSYQSRKAAIDLSRENFLAALSRMHAPVASASGARFRSSLLPSRDTGDVLHTAGKVETASRHAGYVRTPYDRDMPRFASKDPLRSSAKTGSDLDTSAMPEPAQVGVGGLDPSKPHDVGDSMMEMLSPERKPMGAESVLLLAETNKTATKAGGSNGLSSLSSNKRVSQLFDRHRKSLKPSADDTPTLAAGKRASFASASIDSSATESVEEVFQTQPAKEPHRLSEAVEVPKDLAVGRDFATPVAPKSPKSRSVDRKELSDSVAIRRASRTPQSLDQPATKQKPAITPLQAQASDPAPTQGPVSVSEPAAAALGSVSSNVLQNLFTDALAPLREQISGEIRNLHLDMMRQNFVYQEQIEALRRECSEARALRREMEQLRRENEQLRRYVPFYNFVKTDNGDGAAPSESSLK